MLENRLNFSENSQELPETQPIPRRNELSSFWSKIGDKTFLPLLLLIGITVLLPGLGSSQILTQGDEEMHIATIRESLSESSYLFPKFEGVMNLYKPPALFWSGMLSDSLLGTSIFAERFPSLLLFLGTSLFLYFGLRTVRAKPFVAFFISGSFLFTLGAFKFSRLVMMESFLVFFLAATSSLFLKYRVSGKRIWLLAAGLLSGSAFLVKGPVFQVYSGIVLASLSCTSVFVMDQVRGWTGWKRIGKEIVNNGLFHVFSLVIPFVWVLSLLLFSEAGRAFLNFFFVTENLGKYSSATVNQEEWILPIGWLLYSLPFSFLLIFANGLVLASKPKNAAQAYGKALVWASVAILLVHLTPNRKDYYYALPILPLAFLGAGVFFSRTKSSDWKKPLYYNLIFLLGFWTVLALVKTVTQKLTEAPFLPDFLLSLFLIGILAALVLGVFRKAEVPSVFALGNLIVAGSLMAYVQFSLIPSLSLPDLPETGSVWNARQVCVISENPWTALTYRNALAGAEIAHSIPGSERNCVDGRRAVLDYVTNWEPKVDYRLVQSWPIRKRDLSWKEFVGPGHGLEYVRLYEPTGESKNSEVK
ncbi:phospholipid carrier-dependent glycosyltransferase [Leptospira fluminis]|uniref:Phospholipid carrier-dependent glycosyltransferase n=1 Tax=Leptospira fluminis TaxID=2484979 RepID=A0A4R9GR40_9LEPT|nr:phospholipid carrier-dependent glycosyltransferase [Leptospira fluminis]TGK20107.1 phospholipid carrier-dependent glycosyltransferase [Leptospira fluminis]